MITGIIIKRIIIIGLFSSLDFLIYFIFDLLESIPRGLILRRILIIILIIITIIMKYSINIIIIVIIVIQLKQLARVAELV